MERRNHFQIFLVHRSFSQNEKTLRLIFLKKENDLSELTILLLMQCFSKRDIYQKDHYFTVRFRGPSQITLNSGCQGIVRRLETVSGNKHIFIAIPVLWSNLEVQFMLIKRICFLSRSQPLNGTYCYITWESRIAVAYQEGKHCARYYLYLLLSKDDLRKLCAGHFLPSQ